MLIVPGYQLGRAAWYGRAERRYNARVVPVIKADPRFRWVLVGGEANHVQGFIAPAEFVDAPADLAALRAVLQAADPPLPLDFRNVVVMPAVPRPATMPASDLSQP